MVSHENIKLNPFYHRPHWTFYEYIKLFYMSFTILPFKIIGSIVIFLVLHFFVCLAYWFGSRGKSLSMKKDYIDSHMIHEKPLSGFIYCLLVDYIINHLVRALLWVCGFYNIKIKGNPDPNAKVLVCAPHSTFADSIVVMYPRLKSIVAKRAAKNLPIFGTLLTFIQPIWVERGESKSRKVALQTISNRVHAMDIESENEENQSNGTTKVHNGNFDTHQSCNAQILKRRNSLRCQEKWPQICIFPEGTCTNRKALIPFKKGAFFPGHPVQPVCIRYTNKFDCLTWTWDGPHTLLVIWWSLCQFQLSITLEYLSTYYPSKEERQDPNLFAQNVRELMAKHLNIPLSDYTYEDVRNDWEKTQSIKRFRLIQSVKDDYTNNKYISCLLKLITKFSAHISALTLFKNRHHEVSYVISEQNDLNITNFTHINNCDNDKTVINFIINQKCLNNHSLAGCKAKIEKCLDTFSVHKAMPPDKLRSLWIKFYQSLNISNPKISSIHLDLITQSFQILQFRKYLKTKDDNSQSSVAKHINGELSQSYSDKANLDLDVFLADLQNQLINIFGQTAFDLISQEMYDGLIEYLSNDKLHGNGILDKKTKAA